MKIFISWSGNRSKSVASLLKQWLADVLQGDQIFMSEHDIGAGSRWLLELNNELETSHFGIICVTPENLDAPWLLFEAGALSKAVKLARVVPYLLDVKITDIVGPLAQFQGVEADEIGTYKLLGSINSARELRLADDQLSRAFEKWWPDLRKQLGDIPLPSEKIHAQRSDRALLEEMLQLLRNVQREVTVQPSIFSLTSFTKADIDNMNLTDLSNHLNTLSNAYFNADTQSEKSVLAAEIGVIKREISRRLKAETANLKEQTDSEGTAA
jgi:hypothetical protein